MKALAARVKDDKAVRGSVVGGLKEHSARHQASVLDFLYKAAADGRVANIVTHWMANAITCDATKEVVEMLALHPDVLVIGHNKEIQVVESCEVYGDVQPVATSSHSATPHVLQVNADDVWALGYTGKNVVVAILDSGTNPDHYDLKDHLWSGYADADGDGEKDDLVNGWNFVGNNSNITDDYGHGTHCAGIVCGDGSVGNVTGVAPDATLMTVKVVNRTGGGTPAQMMSGVEFAVENGADVLSMSLGFKRSQISDADIELLRRTFENTLLLGVPVCAAAGNDGNSYGAPYNVDFPAACPPPYLHPDQMVNAGGLTSVICVGSVNVNDEYVSSSSQGPVTWQGTSFCDYPYDAEQIGLIRPDISAPGDLIYSLKHDENDKYKYMSGTSQATPCVAGVIALMLEKNPDLTPAQICETIETTAKKLTAEKSNLTGSGRIDALAAVNSVKAEKARPFIRLARFSPVSMTAGDGRVLNFTIENSGKGASVGDVTSVLSTADPYVTIVDGVASHGLLSAGDVAEDEFVINVGENTPNGHTAYMQITTSDGVYEWRDDIAVVFDNYARIVYLSSTPAIAKPGKNVAFSIDFVNKGTAATTSATKVTVTTASPYAAMVVGEAMLEPMAAGEVSTAEFVVDIDESIPDNSNISFDIYAVPGNYTTVESFVFEFESGLDDAGYALDGFDSWTTFDASNDGRNHPWWHSSVAGTHRVESVGEAHSGIGQMMSETYCQASMMEYAVPIDNYLVSPKVKVAAGGKMSFWARVHSAVWFGEHFGVAVSENGNSSATDFVMLDEWTITKDNGDGWIEYTVDLSAYEGKEIYVAIRHFFTAEQWEELYNGYDVYILHIDDVMFHNVVDVSTEFVYDNYSYFSLLVEGNPLPAPSNVVAVPVGTGSVKISWDAVKNAQRYNIYRDGVYVANTTGLEYTDGGLSSDTEYSYCIAAVYNDKEYEWSAAANATTGKADYSVKVKAVVPEVLAVGENVLQITMLNNGRYEQKSRSTLTLTTDDPYVTVKSGAIGLNALYVGQELTKSFTIEIDRLVPDGHKIGFNINVTELYMDKNSWDCPFVLNVANGEREAIVSAAKSLVDGWGVGYPNENAKQAYRDAVDAALLYSDIAEARAALYAADVAMPEDGRAYYIKAKFDSENSRYLYQDVNGLAVAGDCNVKPEGLSGVFVFRHIADNRYALVNNSGQYMVYCANGKEGVGGSLNGFVGDYAQGDNDAEITFLQATRLQVTNPVTVDAATEFFGGFAMYAYNGSDKAMYYMTAGEDGFHSLYSNSLFYDGAQSSVFYLEEASYPNTPKLNAISGSPLVAGIDADGLATFSSPFPVLVPDGITVYYAQRADEDGVVLAEYDGDALPANEGVLIAGNAGVATMTPALNERIEEMDNLFSHSAGAAVQMEYGGAYLLAGGSDGPGFYLCSAGVLAMNKAYLPSSLIQGAPANMVLRYNGTTGVLSPIDDASADRAVYDLCGRRVQNPGLGLYIVGGKKIYIK
ncbi:MAG: S8 family serine peptidase [Bacteroidaceae bacterium]|nr:S8 family serine peptidase [Bacteroidaceae bacterium]